MYGQVAPKIIPFLPLPPSGCVNSPFEPNPIPQPEYCRLSVSEFVVFAILIAPNKQFLKRKLELIVFGDVL